MTTPSYVKLSRRLCGLAQCCGATNSPCDTPLRSVIETATGCETCGHSKGCHDPLWEPEPWESEADLAPTPDPFP